MTPATTISERSRGGQHRKTKFYIGINLRSHNEKICENYLSWIQAGKGQPRTQLLADEMTETYKKNIKDTIA